MSWEVLTDKIFIDRFIRFCIVGGSGLVVDFGITFLCKEILKFNKYAANSTGFVCAATSNFILNRVWTFASSDPDIVGQYIRFVGFALVGLLINNSIIWLLNGRGKLNFYLVKLIATAVVTIWNFSMNYIFTF